MAKFKFVVSTDHLDLVSPTKVIADSINATSMVFEFRSPEWNGAEKWAHLSNPDYNDGQIYDIDLIDDEISEDRGVNLAPGVWSIYLHGMAVDEDGNFLQRYVTDTQTFKIIPIIPNGEPLPVIDETVAEQIDAKATAAINARILSATAEVDNRYGVPKVDVEITGEDRRKNIHLDFHNLKGNGIESLTFVETGDNAGVLTVVLSNGSRIEYSGLKVAVDDIYEKFNEYIKYATAYTDPNGDGNIEIIKGADNDNVVFMDYTKLMNKPDVYTKAEIDTMLQEFQHQ